MILYDVTSVLCGSEGSLDFVVEATLNLLPIPKVRRLLNIGYSDFQSALRDVSNLMELNPLSIETVDSKVLNMARSDVVW